MPLCPSCESPDTGPAWRYKDFEIYECHACNLHFTNPMEAGSQAFYEKRYEDYMADAVSGNTIPDIDFSRRRSTQRFRS